MRQIRYALVMGIFLLRDEQSSKVYNSITPLQNISNFVGIPQIGLDESISLRIDSEIIPKLEDAGLWDIDIDCNNFMTIVKGMSNDVSPYRPCRSRYCYLHADG
jgi:hypothetical protein